MKKNIITLIFLLVIFLGYFSKSSDALVNPWIECRDDMSCAAKKAGFNFPLLIDNYSLRAMKGMIEVKFPFDKRRIVTIRKAQTYEGKADENGIIDISGDYNNYPVNKTLTLKNGVKFSVRGQKNRYYVANFAAETGYYSFYCEKGLTIKDINYFYKLLNEAEAPRNDFSETETYSIEKLMELKSVDDIVEPVYTQDCFPRTLEKKGVTKNCFERANLGFDGVCSASEVKMIKRYYKKGQDKDPLNDGSGGFCAEE